MSKLQMVSDSELNAEVERRKLNASTPAPNPIVNPNWLPLHEMCIDYISQLDNQGWVDDDLKHYIFETALEAVYGKDIWKFINSKR